MKKYKGAILAIQIFCVLLLISSKYIEPGVTQVAYCFTAFSSPFLLLAYGEDAFFSDATWWPAMAVFIAEFLISFLFVGAMITGMRMGSVANEVFGLLLFAYLLSTVFSVSGYFARGGRHN